MLEQPIVDHTAELINFPSLSGATIFQIPLQEFPMLWGYAYLVLVTSADGQEYRVLIDTGSGYGESNQHLEAGLQAVAGHLGRKFSWEDLTHVLITHGHIDHFGGLSYVRPRTQALIGVHELDLRNLTNYEERLLVVAQRLDDYLVHAGVGDEQRQKLINLYQITKSLHSSVRVDFTYEAIGMRLGPFEMFHVPGHCAGHVVIRLQDVIFTGDHILNDTSPHQSPEELTLGTGLAHYLNSLDRFENYAQGVRLCLGGHKSPITDLVARLEEIRAIHKLRLEQVLDYLTEAHTIVDVSRHLFSNVHGYNVLLALEEAGAHVEYLYQRGKIGIANLDVVRSRGRLAPILYQRV